jgi:hypothetical protein
MDPASKWSPRCALPVSAYNCRHNCAVRAWAGKGAQTMGKTEHGAILRVELSTVSQLRARL